MRAGERVKHGAHLEYTDKISTVGWPPGNVFNTMSDDEERTRMRITLAGSGLVGPDVEFFIDRVLYKDTYKTLATRYNMTCARTALRKFNQIRDYLKDTLK